MSRKLDDFLNSRVRNPKQREFFEEHAETWDLGAHHSPEKIEYILDRAGVHDGQDILDVGTGTGVMIPYYLARMDSGSITGLDYSANMIAKAREKYPESGMLRYRVMDLYDLEETEAYDRVICYSCFPHFPDPLGAVRVLTHAVREGGLFCVAHSDSAEFINGVHRDGGDEIHCDYLPEMDVMKEMFRICGLEVVFTRDDVDYYIAVGRKL